MANGVSSTLGITLKDKFGLTVGFQKSELMVEGRNKFLSKLK